MSTLLLRFLKYFQHPVVCECGDLEVVRCHLKKRNYHIDRDIEPLSLDSLSGLVEDPVHLFLQALRKRRTRCPNNVVYLHLGPV